MKIHFFGVVLLSMTLFITPSYSADSFSYKSFRSSTKITKDFSNIITAPNLDELLTLVCASWFLAFDDIQFNNGRTYTITSYENYILDDTIQCGFRGDVFNSNGSPRSINALFVTTISSGNTYGQHQPFTVGVCEAAIGDTFDTYIQVGLAGDYNYSNDLIPFITCNNSCSYRIALGNGIKFAVTEEVAQQFGCVDQLISECGDLAPVLGLFSYTANGDTCSNIDTGLTQPELLQSSNYSDPCENGPNEYDANCAIVGTLTSFSPGNNQTLEQLLASSTNPAIALVEDADGTTDGWSLLNGTIDNGTNEFNVGDSSSNYSGDFITEINNYYTSGSGSGGDSNVTVDNSGVIAAVNASNTAINQNIDKTNTKLDDIINFNSQGMSDLADGTTLIDNDPNFLERSSKITGIIDGSQSPFGQGWEGVFPTISGAGECPNIDFTIRGITLDLTSDFFCQSIALITVTLDFLFFFYTIFSVFNIWRSALTEVI
jgi:hypothetical protein